MCLLLLLLLSTLLSFHEVVVSILEYCVITKHYTASIANYHTYVVLLGTIMNEIISILYPPMLTLFSVP